VKRKASGGRGEVVDLTGVESNRLLGWLQRLGDLRDEAAV